MASQVVQPRHQQGRQKAKKAVKAYAYLHLSAENVAHGELLDFSDTQACIRTDVVRISLGDQFRLTLWLSYTYSIECLAEVAGLIPGYSVTVRFRSSFRREKPAPACLSGGGTIQWFL